jgi:acyl dehydratase
MGKICSVVPGTTIGFKNCNFRLPVGIGFAVSVEVTVRDAYVIFASGLVN